MDLKKIHIKELLLLLIFLVILKCGITTIYNEGWLSHPEYIKYMWEVRTLDKISVDELNNIMDEKSSDKTYLIYTGRKSCPVCVALLPQIKEILFEGENLAEERTIEAYYFDSEKYDSKKTDDVREKLGIKTVPSIVVMNGAIVEVYDSKAIQEEGFKERFIGNIIK